MHKPIFVLTLNRDYVPSSEEVFEMVSNHYDYVTETKGYTIDHLRHQLSDMFLQSNKDKQNVYGDLKNVLGGHICPR